MVKPDFSIKIPLTKIINFGKIPVHVRATYPIPIQNISTSNIYIQTTALDPLGGFSCPIKYVPNDVSKNH